MVDGSFQAFLKDGDLRAPRSPTSTQNWGTQLQGFHADPPRGLAPGSSRAGEGLGEFVREQLPFRYMRISPEAAAAYRQFLQARYQGNIAELNKAHQADYKSFAEIDLPAEAAD